MPIQIQNISKSFGIDTVLENISMNIGDNEKVGLIGVNGAGKTTLLKIIAGELSLDSGVIFKPKDFKIGFLHQINNEDTDKTIWQTMTEVFSDLVQLESDLREMEGKMSDTSLTDEEHKRVIDSYATKSEQFEKAGGFKMRADIMTVLNGMGFEGFDLNMPAKNLSGGERTKLAMCKLLAEAPEILLLDEPTNHLDFKTMQWLENYLKSYKGAVITVSHDRYFLDSTVNTIYEIECNRCTRYSTNYSGYLIQKAEKEQLEQKHYMEQQAQIKKLEDYVDRNRARASTAKSAKSKQKAIDRMEPLEKPTGQLGACKFNFDMEYPSYKDVLTVQNLQIQVNKGGILTTISKNINFEIKRGEKIALIGANGVGKSTLLKTLLEINKNYLGEFEYGRNVEISYYDQEQKLLDDKKRVIDEIWDRLPRLDEVVIRTMLGGMLFSEDDVYKLVGDLSGGERARLMLLIVMIQKRNTMFLDEPTNHLDLPSKEALDTAIKDYPGTLFVVSHDRYFLNKTVDKIFEMTENGINVYLGNFDDYVFKKSQLTALTDKSQSNSTKKTANDYETEKRRQANIKNRIKKMEKAEADIGELETKIEELNKSLEACGADYEKAKKIYDEIEKTQNTINELYELWESLEAELEELNNQ